MMTSNLSQTRQQTEQPPGLKTDTRDRLQDFLQGLKEALTDLIALEVDTIVVTEITGNKFNPYSAYDDIYKIPDTTVSLKEKLKNDENFHLRGYFAKKFKTQEDCETFLATINPDERLPGKYKDFEKLIIRYVELKTNLKRVYKIIKKSEEAAENYQNNNDSQNSSSIPAEENMDGTEYLIDRECKKLPSLPELYTQPQQELFRDGTFMRELRNIRELFGALKGANAANPTNICDVIYAQTIIQIDGDTINRFHNYLFDKDKVDDDEKQFLIETHKSAVASGTENWRTLFETLLNFIEKIIGAVGRL